MLKKSGNSPNKYLNSIANFNVIIMLLLFYKIPRLQASSFNSIQHFLESLNTEKNVFICHYRIWKETYIAY